MKKVKNQPIQNRYEFMLIFDCENGNPNGDPDAANLPRIDSQNGFGLVSDVSLKRKVRDFAHYKGHEIFIQKSTNLNRMISEAREVTHSLDTKSTRSVVHEAGQIMCERFFDVRTFGAVMTTGANAGQITGPVQIFVARSLEPVHVIDWGITRVAITQDVPAAKSSTDYNIWEENQDVSGLRTMGRKSLIPYGVYVAKGCISAFDAAVTGFSETDLELFFEALMGMFDHSRSANRGLMSSRRLFVFRHLGSSTKPEERIQQAKLGVAPAHRLLDLGRVVKIAKVHDDLAPRNFDDYEIKINQSALPEHVEMLDLEYWDRNTFIDNWQKREP